MATTEERVDKLETRFMTLEQQVSTVAAKVDMVIGELQQQREDMRRLHERQDAVQAKHDAEMKAMQEKQDAEMKARQEKQDAEMKAMQEKQDAKFHEMNQRFYDKIDANHKEFTKELHSNFVQTMLGVGAIMAAIGSLIIATLK